MAKFIRINDNLSINIDSIYSIAFEVSNIVENQSDIDEYENKLKEHCSELPYLEIMPGVIWKPESLISEPHYNDLYCEALQKWVEKDLGEIPLKIYKKNYYLILINGTKVNIDKTIYDKVMTFVEI